MTSDVLFSQAMHRSDLRLFSNCMSLGCRTCTLPCWNASRTAPQQMQMLLEGEKTSWVTHLPHENHQKSIRINQSLPPKSSQTSKSPDSGDLHLSDGWETPSSSLAPHFIGNMATHSSLAPSKHWIVVFTPTSSQILSNVPDSWVLHSSSCLVAPFNQHPPQPPTPVVPWHAPHRWPRPPPSWPPWPAAPTRPSSPRCLGTPWTIGDGSTSHKKWKKWPGRLWGWCKWGGGYYKFLLFFPVLV